MATVLVDAENVRRSLWPNIPKGESGHPLEHKFTKSIPSSQCITCHVHNGNGFINTYLGYMWWDEQTDGEFIYPKQQHNPTPAELDKAGKFKAWKPRHLSCPTKSK